MKNRKRLSYIIRPYCVIIVTIAVWSFLFCFVSPVGAASWELRPLAMDESEAHNMPDQIQLKVRKDRIVSAHIKAILERFGCRDEDIEVLSVPRAREHMPPDLQRGNRNYIYHLKPGNIVVRVFIVNAPQMGETAQRIKAKLFSSGKMYSPVLLPILEVGEISYVGELGEVTKGQYVTMPFLQGTTLDSVKIAQPYEVLLILRQVLEAACEFHRNLMLPRDYTLDNFMLDSAIRLKFFDYADSVNFVDYLSVSKSSRTGQAGQYCKAEVNREMSILRKFIGKLTGNLIDERERHELIIRIDELTAPLAQWQAPEAERVQEIERIYNERIFPFMEGLMAQCGPAHPSAIAAPGSAQGRTCAGSILRPLAASQRNGNGNGMLLPNQPKQVTYERAFIILLAPSRDGEGKVHVENEQAVKRLLMMSYDDIPDCFPLKLFLRDSIEEDPENSGYFQNEFFTIDLDAIENAAACKTMRNGEEIIMGRGSDLRINLSEDTISWEHVKVERSGNLITMTDLGSKNGTSQPQVSQLPRSGIVEDNVTKIEYEQRRLSRGTPGAAVSLIGMVKKDGSIVFRKNAADEEDILSFRAEQVETLDGVNHYKLVSLTPLQGTKPPLMTVLTLAASLDKASRRLFASQTNITPGRIKDRLRDILISGITPGNMAEVAKLIGRLNQAAGEFANFIIEKSRPTAIGNLGLTSDEAAAAIRDQLQHLFKTDPVFSNGRPDRNVLTNILRPLAIEERLNVGVVVDDDVAQVARPLMGQGVSEILRRVLTVLDGLKSHPISVHIGKKYVFGGAAVELEDGSILVVMNVDFLRRPLLLLKGSDAEFHLAMEREEKSPLIEEGRTVFVLAHELGHVARKHRGGVRPWEGVIVTIEEARQQEYEADEDAVRCLLQLGFTPSEIRKVWDDAIPADKIPIDPFSDHPTKAERIVNVNHLLENPGFLFTNKARYPRQTFAELIGFAESVPTTKPHSWLKSVVDSFKNILHIRAVENPILTQI